MCVYCSSRKPIYNLLNIGEFSSFFFNSSKIVPSIILIKTGWVVIGLKSLKVGVIFLSLILLNNIVLPNESSSHKLYPVS